MAVSTGRSLARMRKGSTPVPSGLQCSAATARARRRKVARTALANLLAWRLDIAHVDPTSSLTWVSGGNERYAAGVPVVLRTVSGHRDTGFTTCPGAALYAQLRAIAQQAGAIGLPKLYAPTARGAIGGQVRFRAHLSESLPWTVTVADSTGHDRGDRHRHEPGHRLDVGRHSGCAGLVLVDDRGGRHGSQRNRHHRREGCRTGDPLGDGGSADDHAERRRADRLEPHHVHAHRPRNRNRDVAWSRRARSLRPLLASAQTAESRPSASRRRELPTAGTSSS